MRKLVVLAAAAAVVSFSAQGAEMYKDYTVSKEVSDVTFIKVKPNKFSDYLDGIRQTWLPGCEIGKKLGTVVGCAIYTSTTPAGGDFNLILVMTSPSAAMDDPDEAMNAKFMAEMRARLAEDKQDQIVEGYQEMRSFYDEREFREIKFK